MRSASIPPLRNYTCLKFNTFSHVARPRDWVLTGAFDYGELTMPVSLLLMPIRLLCEQRTGGEFREVEDDRKRTGRLFTIITGWSWRRVTDSALSQRRNFWGINNILNLDRGYIIEVKAAGGRDFRLDLSSCRRSFCSLYQTIAARSLPRYRMRCKLPVRLLTGVWTCLKTSVEPKRLIVMQWTHGWLFHSREGVNV